MKFPGKRKNKHYFPVGDRDRLSFTPLNHQEDSLTILGIDQLLVDIEARLEEAQLAELGIEKGQSVILDERIVEDLYRRLKEEDRVVGEFSGGSVGNTLHNYSVLADDHSCLLGTITNRITVGDYAFHYIRSTSARVNLNHLHPHPGPMGRAFCFVTPDGGHKNYHPCFGIRRVLSPMVQRKSRCGDFGVKRGLRGNATS